MLNSRTVKNTDEAKDTAKSEAKARIEKQINEINEIETREQKFLADHPPPETLAYPDLFAEAAEFCARTSVYKDSLASFDLKASTPVGSACPPATDSKVSPTTRRTSSGARCKPRKAVRFAAAAQPAGAVESNGVLTLPIAAAPLAATSTAAVSLVTPPTPQGLPKQPSGLTLALQERKAASDSALTPARADTIARKPSPTTPRSSLGVVASAARPIPNTVTGPGSSVRPPRTATAASATAARSSPSNGSGHVVSAATPTAPIPLGTSPAVQGGGRPHLNIIEPGTGPGSTPPLELTCPFAASAAASASSTPPLSPVSSVSKAGDLQSIRSPASNSPTIAYGATFGMSVAMMSLLAVSGGVFIPAYAFIAVVALASLVPIAQRAVDCLCSFFAKSSAPKASSAMQDYPAAVASQPLSNSP